MKFLALLACLTSFSAFCVDIHVACTKDGAAFDYVSLNEVRTATLKAPAELVREIVGQATATDLDLKWDASAVSQNGTFTISSVAPSEAVVVYANDATQVFAVSVGTKVGAGAFLQLSLGQSVALPVTIKFASQGQEDKVKTLSFSCKKI